jgi:putative hydrolase of the HAD superfamily
VKYKAIIFDVSDTLVKYSPNYAQIYGDRLRKVGYDISNEKAVEISIAVNLAIGDEDRRKNISIEKSTNVNIETIMDKAALSCVASYVNGSILEELSRIFIPSQKMEVIPGVLKVLETLRIRYRLAIVSNHYTWLKEKLVELGLAKYFETIVISEIVGVTKPDIRIMQIALQELLLEAENCLYVGDQPNDVLCAKSAGMDCALITTLNSSMPAYIPYKEDYKIFAIEELLDFL